MRLDETVALRLKTDEAVVLGYLLSREIWNRGGERLFSCIEHPAEEHALHALLQELSPTLLKAGGTEDAAEQNNRAARASLVARYSDQGS